MRYFSSINLVFLLLANLFLFTGCGTKLSNSAHLTEKQIPKLSLQDNCNEEFNDELSDTILAKVEKDSAELTSTDSDSAKILLNSKWIERLGDDATYFINYNEQLNKQRASLLESKKSLVQSGVVMSPCQMDDEGRLIISFAEQNNVQSNFPNLVKSYNKSITKRNDSYEERLSKFQKDFQGTNFIIKSKKSFNNTEQNLPDKKADSDYLRSLYQNRIKHLLNFSKG